MGSLVVPASENRPTTQAALRDYIDFINDYIYEIRRDYDRDEWVRWRAVEADPTDARALRDYIDFINDYVDKTSRDGYGHGHFGRLHLDRAGHHDPARRNQTPLQI